MEIHSLQELDEALRSGMVLAIDNGTVTSKVDVTTIEKHAIESYAGSTIAGAAQSVKAALDGLIQKSLPTEIAPRTTIASNDDLNTYTTAGIYRCATATIAASLSNCPVSNVGFNLDVVQLYNTAFAYQRITASTGTGATAVVEVYERFINVRDSMYGTWKKVPTRAEVDSILKPYKVGGSTPDVDDCNSLPRNSIGYTYASALNSPDAGYQIFTYGLNDSNKVQLALRGTVNPKIKTRLLTGGNWSAWVESARQTDVDELSSNTYEELASDASSGTVTISRYGKMRILTFTDVVASSNALNLSTALATTDRPRALTSAVLFASDNSVARVWVRLAGTIGTTNVTSGKTYNGELVYIVA